jgi:hypothetical protein
MWFTVGYLNPAVLPELNFLEGSSLLPYAQKSSLNFLFLNIYLHELDS